MDGFRRELSLRSDWTLAGGFDLIDIRAPRGRIDRIEIGDFLRAHGQPITEDGLDAIIRRTDTDEDEALSFDEFADVFRDTAYVAPVEVVKPVYRPYTSYYEPAVTYSPYRVTRSPVRVSRVAPLIETSPYRRTRYHSPYRSFYRSFY